VLLEPARSMVNGAVAFYCFHLLRCSRDRPGTPSKVMTMATLLSRWREPSPRVQEQRCHGVGPVRVACSDTPAIMDCLRRSATPAVRSASNEKGPNEPVLQQAGVIRECEEQGWMQDRAARASGGHRLSQTAAAAASAQDGIEPEHADRASGEEVAQLSLRPEILPLVAEARSEHGFLRDE
jgi:hypothetical protein